MNTNEHKCFDGQVRTGKQVNCHHCQYTLALSIGNKRFGSECKHENVKGGKCQHCQRRVK